MAIYMYTHLFLYIITLKIMWSYGLLSVLMSMYASLTDKNATFCDIKFS